MYLLKHKDRYVSQGDGYFTLSPHQRDAVRIDDTTAALAKVTAGYLSVHKAYRLVKLRPRASDGQDGLSTVPGHDPRRDRPYTTAESLTPDDRYMDRRPEPPLDCYDEREWSDDTDD